MIKVLIFIILYLLCGIGTLELISFHDRKVDRLFDKWADDLDTTEQTIVVILCPLFIVLILFWAVGKGLGLIIKGLRVFITTIVYSLVALIRGTNDKNN